MNAVESSLGGTSRTILLAEDDAETRLVLSVSLRSLGYDVVEAATGGRLLELLADVLLGEEPGAMPGILISDHRLPGVTGLEVIAGLRAAGWRTPMILMTAYAEPATKEEAAKLAVDAFFEKPFEIDDLLTVVVNLRTPTLAPVH